MRTMNKTVFLGLTGAAVLPAVAHAAERPNILLVLSDDHSYPHLGAYGEANCTQFDLTPAIDALAKDGVLFNKAYVAAPHSAPSRVAIFSGCNPIVTCSSRFMQAAKPEFPYFIDLLRDAGYWVGLTGRGHHLSTSAGENASHTNAVLDAMGTSPSKFAERYDLAETIPTRDANLLQVSNRMNAILETVGDKPFFLYYGITQPHTPWPTTYPDIDVNSIVMPPDWPDMLDMRKFYAKYLQALTECNYAFEQMIATLKARDEYDNTLIIFVGDNGESLPRGKGTHFDRGCHVPLIIKYPNGTVKGVSNDELVSSLDLTQTMLEVAGVEPTAAMEGKSLVPVLKGESYEGHQYIFTERGWHPGMLVGSNAFEMSRVVSTERYTLIFNPMTFRRRFTSYPIEEAYKEGNLEQEYVDMYFKMPRPALSLFDLETDPYQMKNLWGDPAYVVIQEELLTQLDSWMLRNQDFLPLPSSYVE